MTNVLYDDLDMRRDVQEIFRMTPHEKQVMMFSATLGKEMRVVCKKFMQDVIIIVTLNHLFVTTLTSFFILLRQLLNQRLLKFVLPSLTI